MRKSNWKIVKETPKYVLIKDLGPWSEYLSVTNDVDNVVKAIAPRLKGRRLFYIDSGDVTDELLVKNGEFYGFAFGGPDDGLPT